MYLLVSSYFDKLNLLKMDTYFWSDFMPILVLFVHFLNFTQLILFGAGAEGEGGRNSQLKT